MSIAHALTVLRPGEEWTLEGDTYDGLTWLSGTPKPTAAEIDAADSQHAAVGALRAANTDTLHAQATTALAQNRAAIAATAPTNAQVIAQVKNLSAQNNALIRLVLGLLDATD
jgi:hypothetical protein